MNCCERCGVRQPRVMLLPIGDWLVCWRCAGDDPSLPLVPVFESPNPLPPEDGSWATDRQICDVCRVECLEAHLVGIHVYLDGELVPVDACRYCADRAVYFPDDDWQRLREVSEEIKNTRRLRLQNALLKALVRRGH
jgi:hypothetical protein